MNFRALACLTSLPSKRTKNQGMGRSYNTTCLFDNNASIIPPYPLKFVMWWCVVACDSSRIPDELLTSELVRVILDSERSYQFRYESFKSILSNAQKN